MKRRLTIALLGLAAIAPMVAKTNITDVKTSITDPAIIYPESFETDTQKLLEGWYMKGYTASDSRYRTESDPNVTDETIIRRLSALPTVIEMPFNQIVRSYIDRYTKKGRPQVAALLGLSLYYMPIFEQALEAKGLPLELKYLPVIESGLDPNAVSKHGAAGLWQFIPAAAKGLDMELNSLVDERRDPYVSSERAAQFLKELYDAYGDWSLAIAAYNCGPGTVNKALRRAGGDDPTGLDFWAIYSYLPEETRGYVPMFIAANYVMNYYGEHNISPVLPTKPLVTDTIGVSQRVHFNQISSVLNIPLDELRILNPQYRADIIPGSPDHIYTLILPSQQIHAYIMSEGDILAYEAEKYARRETVEPGVAASQEQLVAEATSPVADNFTEQPTDEEVQEIVAVRNAAAAKADGAPAASGKKRTVIHKVADGETLAAIATMYGTTAAEIKTANGLRRNSVRPGQQLRISTTVPETATAAAKSQQPAKMAQVADNAVKQNKTQQQQAKQKQLQQKQKAQAAKPTTHTIKNGESLSTIARKYGVSVDQLRSANGLKGDAIRAGKTLSIPSKSGKSSGKKKKRR